MKFTPLILTVNLLVSVSYGQVPEPPLTQVLESLRTRKVPEPGNLAQFVKNKAEAIALGKALFWDTQVGSDKRTACASCHFHAGADNRSKNQLSPGLLRNLPDHTYQVGGPNHQLTKEDFPFRKLSDPNNRRSTVISDKNDVSSSQGVFPENYLGLDAHNQEIRARTVDTAFGIRRTNVRRVEPRNTPTVINAIFNQRNFWDGRAMDTFNGVNPFGRRDGTAKLWKTRSASEVFQTSVTIDNASLASQAVGPPLSHFEMSASGKTFQELGRRLLVTKPLALQWVHRQDGVLGARVATQGQGLNSATYADMVKAAFHSLWWSSTGRINFSEAEANQSYKTMDLTSPAGPVTAGASSYSQMEANFSLFFGLALQLYQATLVSDQSPYDKFAEGLSSALSEQQKRGLDIFLDKGRCVNCHGGAEFTNASVHRTTSERLSQMLMGNNDEAVYDEGFYNIGVRPTSDDIGLGGKDPFGMPLSLSRIASQRGTSTYHTITGTFPNTSVEFGDRVTADGLFKAPTLRNVELTAPYFHNGGTRTLREVVDFYNRGGDFADQNINDLSPDITPLGLSEGEKDDLVAFMKSLTDERVRYRRAPFDHPQLVIPNGQLGDSKSITHEGSGKAVDLLRELPATGRSGGRVFPNFLE
jgi:cytochrome c peroxidase